MTKTGDRNDRLVSIADIAEMYGVTVHAVRKWKDRLPPYYPGSKLRWLSEVKESMTGWPSIKNAKFSDEEVREIRGKYWSENWSQQQLATHYQVHYSTISRIISGDRYGDVE